jgi:hypothetical protein
VIFNRVAIRTAMDSPGIVTLVSALLAALKLQVKHIINNRHCHHVGGFGAGVWAPESPDPDVPPSILAAAFAADDVAAASVTTTRLDALRVSLLGMVWISVHLPNSGVNCLDRQYWEATGQFRE